MEEKTIVKKAMSDEMNQVWDTITVPNPSHHINIGLYFDGYLDNDNIRPRIDDVLKVIPKKTEALPNIFKNLCQESKPKPTCYIFPKDRAHST